jgi:hypothetical protein
MNHALPVFLLLVDTSAQKIIWQRISPTTIERLPKGWKVAVPRTHDFETGFIAAARKQVGLDAGASSYTRMTLKDTSNVNAKRYTATILMRPPVTRLRAEAVIRQATADIRKERYNLEGFKALFGDSDAEVVSLFVAGELDDAKNYNWYCRTLWAAPGHVAKTGLAKIGGFDLGDGLEVVWEKDYAANNELYQDLQIGKQEYLTTVKDFTARAKVIIAEAFGEKVQIICSPEVLARLTTAMRTLFLESNKIGLSPYECREIADRFQDAMVFADNAFIYAANALAEPTDMGWSVLMETALKDHRKNLSLLGYEIEKVR